MIDNIYMDMDGVLTNFLQAYLTKINRLDLYDDWPMWEYNIPTATGQTDEEFFAAIDGDEDFWIDMAFWIEPKKLIWHCQRYANVHICTMPTRCPMSLSGKRKWVDKYISKMMPMITIGDKSLLANNRSLLIDDNLDNVFRFAAAGGKVIHADGPHVVNAPPNLEDLIMRKCDG